MLIAYARPDKHQSYQRKIDRDITGLPKKIMTPWYFMSRDLFENTSTAILKYLLLSIKISNAPNCDPRELHLLESLKISNRYKCAPAKRHRRHIKNMYLSNIFQAFPFLSFACLSESLKSKKE